MIDLHNHLLFGLDDGAQTEHDTIDMARAAISLGTSAVIVTPHHNNESYSNPKARIHEQVEKVRTLLAKHQIDLQIYPGQEVRLKRNVLEEIEQNDILTLNQSRYVLVEFPFDHIPSYAKDMFFELKVLGLTPIIAHPERNQEIYTHPERLGQLVNHGALSQITASSLTLGASSKLVQLTLHLCQQNWVHFVASDAHNVTTRPFGLVDAYQVIREHVSEAHASAYQQNAYDVLHNQEINELPTWSKQKKKWSFFGIK